MDSKTRKVRRAVTSSRLATALDQSERFIQGRNSKLPLPFHSPHRPSLLLTQPRILCFFSSFSSFLLLSWQVRSAKPHVTRSSLPSPPLSLIFLLLLPTVPFCLTLRLLLHLHLRLRRLLHLLRLPFSLQMLAPVPLQNLLFHSFVWIKLAVTNQPLQQLWKASGNLQMTIPSSRCPCKSSPTRHQHRCPLGHRPASPEGQYQCREQVLCRQRGIQEPGDGPRFVLDWAGWDL